MTKQTQSTLPATHPAALPVTPRGPLSATLLLLGALAAAQGCFDQP